MAIFLVNRAGYRSLPTAGRRLQLVKLTKHGRTVIPQATSERVTVDFSWGG